jgi:PKD repeat protein
LGNGAVLDSLRWVFGDGGTLTSLPLIPASVTHRYSGFGLFKAVVTAYNHYGCQATDSMDVNVACISSSFINSDTLACENTRVVFTDNSSPVSLIQSWRWNFGDGVTSSYTKYANKISHTYSNTGTFVVTLIVEAQSGGATVRDTSRLTVVVKTSPVAMFSVSPVCIGDSSRFVNLSDSGGVTISSILWNFGDPTSGVLDTSSLINPVHKYLVPGKHTVTLATANELGCSDTLRSTATVHKLPQAAFTNTAPCQRYDIQFRDKSKIGDTAISLWWWYMGDAQNIYDTLYTKNITYRYDSVGTFYTYLKVQDSFGCSDTTFTPVTVLPSPIAAFTVTEDIDGKPGKIRLNNQSSDDAKGFKWTFGNGKTSNEVSPVVTYTSDAQIYIIELVTWNAGLCYDTTFMSYEFLFDNLFVPNAFSPTFLGDGVGCREFKPKGMNLRDYDVMVFDKWGHLLWESKLLTDDGKGMPAEGWNGTFGGQLMPQDVYMWKISATFKNGKVWEGSDSGKGSTTTMGTVTLIR